MKGRAGLGPARDHPNLHMGAVAWLLSLVPASGLLLSPAANGANSTHGSARPSSFNGTAIVERGELGSGSSEAGRGTEANPGFRGPAAEALGLDQVLDGDLERKAEIS